MKKYVIPSGIKSLWNKVYYGKYANWPKTAWFHFIISRNVYENVRKRARRHPDQPLRVIFFVLDISMWKYESLFELLLADSRFDPLIVPYPLDWHSVEEQKKSEKGIIDYCRIHAFPYLIGYDIDTKEYLPAKALCADFVSWSQPYNNCPVFWKVEQFYKNALVFTYPYGLPIDNNKHFNNLLSQNVSWRLFYNNRASKDVFDKNPFTRGRNFRYVGNVFYDKIKQHCAKGPHWKSTDFRLKRIIWAPHHTIGENDDLPFSNFLKLCDEFVTIAHKFEGRALFAFKPHPLLYHRLLELWGKEKTDEYYQQWSDMPNTCYVSGDYTDLFLTSDAMIHDCAGFTFEYLFTNNPVMFVNMRDNDMKKYMPGFSYQCYTQHYIGRSVEDIEDFIEHVVIEEKDDKAGPRSAFVNGELLPPRGKSVGENMMEEFLSVLK